MLVYGLLGTGFGLACFDHRVGDFEGFEGDVLCGGAEEGVGEGAGVVGFEVVADGGFVAGDAVDVDVIEVTVVFGVLGEQAG